MKQGSAEERTTHQLLYGRKKPSTMHSEGEIRGTKGQ